MKRIKFSGDFEIKTDSPIPARTPDLELINTKKKKEKKRKKRKENVSTGGLCGSSRSQGEAEGKGKDG